MIPKPAAAPPASAPAAQPAPASQATPTPVAAADVAPRGSTGGGLLKQTPAWAVSMLVHIIALLSMALVVSDPPKKEAPRMITASAAEVEETFEEFEEEIPQENPAEEEVISDAIVMPESTSVETVQVVSNADDIDAAPIAVELTDFGSESVAASDLLSSVGAVGGKAAGGVGGRTDAKMRQTLVQTGGGTPQSEAAVEAALKWFIEHQLPDGSWSFDLRRCPNCQGKCKHAEGKGAKSYPLAGPTAMAILPFLGRGYTHKDGPYKRQLEYGLTALATKVVNGKGNAGEGSYVQGLTGICLSEAYAMTQDRRLAMPAQLAVAYVSASQDPVGGGWGYSPKSPGDTSIVGWNLMALKSGHMAFLQIDPRSVKGAVAFLNSVQSDDGSAYGYRDPGNSPPLNAVGLLCRMYLGWKRDHPALKRGAERLAKAGPNNDLYYDYYATQVLHHIEGEQWVSWNNRMRDMLVKAQAQDGHEKGSWFDGVNGGHGPEVGGRIYCTSLATMILEVYYRHLPIYGQQSVDEDFKE
ncbi:MAG: prenyltransferase/squalene oxidase repeat-containing protein [Planctomycetia bacterium]